MTTLDPSDGTVLAAVIAAHFGVDLGNCDPAKADEVRALAQRIEDEFLSKGVITGLVDQHEIQEMMGLSTISVTRSTISRAKDFPDAVVDRKLWRARDVRDFIRIRDQRQGPGRAANTRANAKGA